MHYAFGFFFREGGEGFENLKIQAYKIGFRDRSYLKKQDRKLKRKDRREIHAMNTQRVVYKSIFCALFPLAPLRETYAVATAGTSSFKSNLYLIGKTTKSCFKNFKLKNSHIRKREFWGDHGKKFNFRKVTQTF